MKITTLITFFLTISLNNVFSQWQKLNEGINGNYSSTFNFINDDVGWALIYPSTFIKTTDAGETWEEIPFDKNKYIMQFKFISENAGWVVCSDNLSTSLLILKTIDGGKTWQTKFNEPYDQWYGFSSIQSLDEDHLYATSYNKVIATNNGGETWDDITPQGYVGSYTYIWFVDTNIGIMCYSNYINYKPSILRTTNGGITWYEHPIKGIANIDRLFFLNDSVGYFTALDDSSDNLIYKTSDAGKDWESICKFDSNNVRTLQFVDEQTAYLSTWNFTSKVKQFLKSNDGGNSWSKINTNFNFYNKSYNFSQFTITDLFFNKNNEGIILGNLGNYLALYRSGDGGRNWDMQKYSCPFININFSDSLNGIAFGGYEVGGLHVLNSFGEIFSTNDGGKNWEIIYETPNRIIRTNFIDEDNIYILTKTGNFGVISRIFKSNDRGKNWSEVLTMEEKFNSFNFIANDIKMIDNNNGWLVGYYSDSISNGSIIVETNDGWNTWETKFISKSTENTYYTLNSISFYDTLGFAVGENGEVVKYTPSTGWKEIKTDVKGPLNKIAFKDNLNIWITGSFFNGTEYENILLKTTNGGNSWENVNNFNYKINDMVFIDNSIGWFVGNDANSNGVIFKTINGGQNWELVENNLIGPLFDIEIKDSYVWISGDYGLLLKSKDSILTAIDNKPSLSNDFKLYQNYPNPFNPTTVIEYNIPANVKSETPNVELILYDVLGRKIKTLVNEVQNSGFHKINFNGSGLASGVYYYQIKYDSFIQSKKMLLLK